VITPARFVGFCCWWISNISIEALFGWDWFLLSVYLIFNVCIATRSRICQLTWCRPCPKNNQLLGKQANTMKSVFLKLWENFGIDVIEPRSPGPILVQTPCMPSLAGSGSFAHTGMSTNISLKSPQKSAMNFNNSRSFTREKFDDGALLDFCDHRMISVF
jgi:hypothetical protein